MIKKIKNESGVVLIVCLSILFMLSLIGIASITTSNTDMQIADNEYKTTGAFYAAESGLEKAAASISNSYETTGEAPSPLPSDTTSESNYTYGYYTTDEGPAVNMQIDAGAYKGLYGMVKTFTINSIGIDNNSTAGVELEMQIQDALVPLFQFGVFYEYDMEIAPGPDMTLSGRIHTNGDLYMQAGNDLFIDSYVTAAGNIFQGRKASSGMSTSNRDIWIMDGEGVYQTMKNDDDTFLDSEHDDWVNASLDRWDGRVEDSDHGITDLYMTVVSDGPPTDLIDRDPDGSNPDSYENQAGLKFIDGQAYYRTADDSWLNVTPNMISLGIISAGTFYDGREQQDVLSLDIDIDKLNSSIYFPSNGIVYSSIQESPSYLVAARLVNSQELSAALTVATDNPLYTLGDYNTINKKPAALISDAYTILSNNWDDSRSWGNIGDRSASSTQINACYMTGNTETGEPSNNYSGGFENLPRFLENWSSQSFTWRGSAVDLWYSRQANTPWSDGQFYNPPDRDWAFDPDLLDPNNLPPGTPVINIIQKKNWSQKLRQSADLGNDYNLGE